MSAGLFDMRTIIVSFLLSYLISTLIMLILWVQFKNRYKGISQLLLSFSVQTAGIALIALRGLLPQWLSVDLANTLLISGTILGLMGLEAYTGLRSSQIPNLVILVLFAAVHTWFTIADPDINARSINISITSLLIFSQSAWLMLYRAGRRRLNLNHPIGLVFIGFCLVSIANILRISFGENKLAPDYFDATGFDTIMVIIYHMLVIFLTFSYVLMFSKNLLTDMKYEEEKFAVAFKTTPNAVILSTFPQNKIFEVNNGFTRTTGYEYQEVVGKTVREISLWGKEDDYLFLDKLLDEKKRIFDKELTLRKKSGEEIVCLLTAEIIYINNQQCQIISIDNIAERRRFESDLRYERNLLRSLIDNLPDSVSVKDTNGKYLLVNKALQDFLGAERQEEILGKTVFDFLPGRAAELIDEEDKRVFQSGKMALERMETSKNVDTGFTHHLLTSRLPIIDNPGSAARMITISHDFTDRKRAEDKIREGAEFNRTLLMTIPFGMDIVDESGTILFINENFRKRFNSEPVGKKCWEVYRDDSKQCIDCPLTRGITEGKTERYESQGILGGGLFEIFHTGMMYHGKKAMLEIFNDITSRKNTEEELRRAKEKAEESDRLKSAFLHNVSHEIRTPMNAIVGFTTMLGEPDITPEDHGSYLEIITQSSNHLLSIVTDIIEVSNIEAGKMRLNLTPVKLNSTFARLYSQFLPPATGKGLSIEFVKPEGPNEILITTDSTKLIQVMSNLLANALKFTSTGFIKFGFSVNKETIDFFVSDSGIGIPPEKQPKIFDRFYQVSHGEDRQYEGAGLGLSISKTYVELLGGRLNLDSEVGKGSTFSFSLPC